MPEHPVGQHRERDERRAVLQRAQVERHAELGRVQECLQSVLWNGTLALAPLGQPLPAGLTQVLFTGRPPSHVVVAWSRARSSPLIRSFAQSAVQTCRHTVGPGHVR